MKDQQVQTATVAQNQGTCILQAYLPCLHSFWHAMPTSFTSLLPSVGNIQGLRKRVGAAEESTDAHF